MCCDSRARYLRHGNEFRSVDGTPDILRSIVNDWYGGDWYAMAEEYYGLIGNLYEKTRCRVIAHFDLIEKFNEDGALFDRNNPRYRAVALGALERLYAADYIVIAVCRCVGPVILLHAAENLDLPGIGRL